MASQNHMTHESLKSFVSKTKRKLWINRTPSELAFGKILKRVLGRFRKEYRAWTCFSWNETIWIPRHLMPYGKKRVFFADFMARLKLPGHEIATVHFEIDGEYHADNQIMDAWREICIKKRYPNRPIVRFTNADVRLHQNAVEGHVFKVLMEQAQKIPPKLSPAMSSPDNRENATGVVQQVRNKVQRVMKRPAQRQTVTHESRATGPDQSCELVPAGLRYSFDAENIAMATAPIFSAS